MIYFKERYGKCKTSEDMEVLLKGMKECYNNMIGSFYSGILYNEIRELEHLIFIKKEQEENENS